MVSNALFTSKSQEWETPHSFFNKINQTYNFTLDACATEDNKKCEKFFSEQQNGLKQSWANETVWLNPPYEPARNKCKKNCNRLTCEKRGHHILEPIAGQMAWVKKAYEEVQENNCNCVVCLLPARTDTKLFHHFVMKSSMVVFLKGRLRFVGAPSSSVFPSMLVTFESWNKNQLQHSPIFTTMEL